jgi:hypothetical protein
MKEGDEVIYSIMISVKDTVAHQHAVTALNAAGIGNSQIRITDTAISAPRVYTRWRGDADEREWQRQLRAEMPGTIIDVHPWTYAPGYPIDTQEAGK